VHLQPQSQAGLESTTPVSSGIGGKVPKAAQVAVRIWAVLVPLTFCP